MEKEIEYLQRCRCADCETGRQRGCNSSRLKELLGSLFGDGRSPDDLPGLYCLKPQGDQEIAASETECLCADCDLNESGRGAHCRLAGAKNENQAGDS